MRKMSKYVLSCESTVDLTKSYLQQRHIAYIGYPYELNGRFYQDDFGEALSLENFYREMEQGASTKTAQINAYEFTQYFETFLSQGKDVLHRGHGGSVRDVSDLGYFYTDNAQVIVEDLHDVTAFLQKRYPGYPIYMFSHSMGTLVARNYLKRYDHELSKVILCGPPTKNETIHLAILLAQISSKIHGELYRNHFLNQLVFGPANKKFGAVNAWLSSDAAEVERYIYDPLCGYIFTNNGFLNLFKLQKSAFEVSGWSIGNTDLPILLIAGADDPVIQGEKKFFQLKAFLKQVGYQNISTKLYSNMRHELLNETGRQEVYRDILSFLE